MLKAYCTYTLLSDSKIYEIWNKNLLIIKKKKPKKGELVIVKLDDGTERKCFRCGCKDELHNGWAEPIIGM
jgi:hypothetical protein